MWNSKINNCNGEETKYKSIAANYTAKNRILFWDAKALGTVHQQQEHASYGDHIQDEGDIVCASNNGGEGDIGNGEGFRMVHGARLLALTPSESTRVGCESRGSCDPSTQSCAYQQPTVQDSSNFDMAFQIDWTAASCAAMLV
jgi:hypothetical protein